LQSFDTTEALGDGTNAGNQAPPPRKRHKPLDSLDAVRREMVATYWQMKEAILDTDKGKAQIYVLGKITEVLKAAQEPDEELMKLLKLVKGKLI
jgi:hypothetical protein